jgi:hypothetical protein
MQASVTDAAQVEFAVKATGGDCCGVSQCNAAKSKCCLDTGCSGANDVCYGTDGFCPAPFRCFVLNPSQ